MNESLSPKSEVEQFRNAVKALLEAWKAQWTAGDKGPSYIGDFVRQYISEEQQRAQEPEEHAYAALLMERQLKWCDLLASRSRLSVSLNYESCSPKRFGFHRTTSNG